jgi:hypothetical protein
MNLRIKQYPNISFKYFETVSKMTSRIQLPVKRWDKQRPSRVPDQKREKVVEMLEKL